MIEYLIKREPVRGLHLEQLVHQISVVLGALRTVLDFSLGNLALNLHGGFAGERSIPVKELKEEDTQTP
jgi:hypothetical protein